MTLSLWRLFCIVAGLCSLGAHADNSWLDQFAGRIQADARKHNVPGYVFVFVEKGRPPQIYTYGKTDRQGGYIDENTLFRLASVSKTFTSMLMAKMVDQSNLDWQTSLATLAPDIGFSQSGHAGMTLQHLVGQSSGFMPNAYDNLIEANYPVRRVLNQLADLEPLCAPGKCYTYQNTLFGVLVHYFEQQGTSYEAELSNRVIKPLSMPHASVGKASLVSSSNWAKPHIAIAKDKWRLGHVNPNYYRFAPAAGVNASIRDMVIWIRAMLGEYPDVISPELIDKVTTPQVKTKRELHRRNWRKHLQDAHYGLGWRVYDFNGHKLNYHGGWVKGYRADVAFAPDQKVGYAMLMNAESNLINGFTAEFWQQYFEHYEKRMQVAELSEQVGE